MSGAPLNRRSIWAIGLASGFACFFVFLFAMAMFHDNTRTFATDLAGLKALHGDQCEKPQDLGWLVEPQNTLSNVGYALAGFLILVFGKSWPARFFGANLVTLALMSGLYHATLTRNPQTLDVVWVYAVLLSLSSYAAYVHVQVPSFLKLPWWPLWLIIGAAWLVATVVLFLLGGVNAILAILGMTVFAAAAITLAFIQHAFGWSIWLRWVINIGLAIGILAFSAIIYLELRWDSTIVFAAVVVVLIIQMALTIAVNDLITWRLGGELILIGGIFGLGLLFRMKDGYEGNGDAVTEKWLCLPESAFQAHAWWHLLTAVALLLSYDILVQVNRRSDATGDGPVVLPASQNPPG